MACCVFHNFCQLMNMLELAMCDIWQRRNPLVGFHGQHVFANRKGMQQKRLVKMVAMLYLHHGWNITQQLEYLFYYM